MYLYKNLNEILTLKNAYNKDGRNLLPEDLSLLKNASVAFNNNEILWIGKNEEVPSAFKKFKSFDLAGYCLTPEICDSHTHLVFAGDRAEEYAMRLNGADYQKIAQAGGGILFTMQATRAASFESLFDDAIKRIDRIIALGVGSIEIKSGYGLSFESEYKISKAISKLKEHYSNKGIQILRTYLAAHAVPPEFTSSSDYLREVVLPLMEKLNTEQLIDFVDIFHEEGYFTKTDTQEFFELAKKLNLPIKIHADEFGDNGGAELALEYKAASCDHLLRTSVKTINKFSQSKTVATILPGTSQFLGKNYANVSEFFNSGAIVSFASDYNPGSCHSYNLLQIVSSAAPTLKINQTQLWAGITLNAAKSLRLFNQGAIIEKMLPRFSLFKTDNLSQVTYNWGENLSKALPITVLPQTSLK